MQFAFLPQTAAERQKIAEAEKGTFGRIRLFRYAGVDDKSTLNVNVAIL